LGDEWAQNILKQHLLGENLLEGITVHEGVVRRKEKIYVGTDSDWRSQLITALQDSSIGGYSGILGTYNRVKRYFFWQIKRYCTYSCSDAKLEDKLINEGGIMSASVIDGLITVGNEFKFNSPIKTMGAQETGFLGLSANEHEKPIGEVLGRSCVKWIVAEDEELERRKE
jgi:hypothetical protein